MLQWEWPTVWEPACCEAVRAAMETALRKAMARGQNERIRGSVTVDTPHMGSSPPDLCLSGIREVSLEHTAVMLKLRYGGDFSVTMRGLEINLDMVGPSGEDSEETLAIPFFCPLEITLQSIVVDGMASIEVFQDIDDCPREAAAPPRRPPYGTSPPPMTVGESSASSRAVRSQLSGPKPGYGVLLGAGGRRAMRPPDVLGTVPGGPRRGGSSLPSSDPSTVIATAAPPPVRHSILDLVTKRAVVRQRRVKIQFFGDPLKSIRVGSNISSIPGAEPKVEATIRMLIKPTIEKMMTEGITITF